MRFRSRAFVLFLAPLLALTACGDDDDDASAADTGSGAVTTTDDQDDAGGGDGEGSVDTDEWPPPARGFLPGTGEAGTVTVDGTDQFPIDVVRECDVNDVSTGRDGETLVRWLQGYGPEGPDEWADMNQQLDVRVYERTSPDAVFHAITWNPLQGIWDGEVRETDDDALSLDGTRISGIMELRSTLGDPSIEAEIDVAVPDGEPQECFR